MTVRVTVWNENVHEREEPAVRDLYPDGIHGAIADGLEAEDHAVRTATLGHLRRTRTRPNGVRLVVRRFH